MSSSPTEQEPGTPEGMVEVTLPDLGGRVLEAIVVGWEKHPGEWVERDEPICIVSADGLRAAVASSASGYLVRLLAGVGVRIGPGTSLAEIATKEVRAEVVERTAEPEVADEPTDAPEPGPEPADEPEAEPADAPEPEMAGEPLAEPEPEPLAELEEMFSPLGDRRRARLSEPEPVEMSTFHSPAVKRLADQHGVDLALVVGTGAGGRVRKEDVLAHVEALPSTVDEDPIAEDAQGAGAPDR
jgi:pyruvate dehydrogenase E2 component (dihydrolipoamide acetyltransferase)